MNPAGLRVRRVPAADELAGDGELLVLVEDRAVRVGGLAPEILARTEQWRDVDSLVTELVAELGPPPDGDARGVVHAALEDLARAGLVHVEHVE